MTINGDGEANGIDTNGTSNGEGALELESPTKKLRVSSQVQPEKYTETHTSDEDEEDSEISEYNDAA